MQVQVFIMSFYSNKDKMEGNDYNDICKNHSAKADREMYRVCPSKLSKRELEDLYFTLLENNLELKKTVNGQQDRIRILSTQVQRLTNTQEKLVSKEMRDRGTITKAVVDEQRDCISELKETNQRLADRIQHLNMRLCSAKQFMKTTPPQSAPSRGNRSSVTAVSTPKRQEYLSKGAESPEQALKVSTYSQWEEKTSRKSNEYQNNGPIERRSADADQPCDENKCRTLMEELRLKIATLQEELLNVHGEYATRIGRLETEVLEVRKENVRVISERSASELELADSFKKANDLLTQYRTYEAKCSELATELAIEKRKVAELETLLKVANMSEKVNKTIEDHLTSKQDADPYCTKCCLKDKIETTGSPAAKTDEHLPPSGAATSDQGDRNSTNTGDDSGYQDTDDQGLLKQNKELIAKILELQRQIDCLKIGEINAIPASEPLVVLGSSPSETADNSDVTLVPPLLEAPAKAETPAEQIQKSLKYENYKSVKPIPSDDIPQQRKILRIEVLGNPEENGRPREVRRQTSEDTRAKTIEEADGTQYITDDPLPIPDKYGYPDVRKNEYREHMRETKFEIVEKQKREGSIPALSTQDRGNISLRSATSMNPGPGFNPEKIKYLEAEGLKTDMPKFTEESLSESIPSNPELGFGIPRLASKGSQDKAKTEKESGQPKRLLNTSISGARESEDLEPTGTEAMRGNQKTVLVQADEDKPEEDCQYCAACTFDKECAHAIKPKMDKLALGIQKGLAKKHDQHNSLQIPGPIPTTDTTKKEKKRNVFSHFRKQKKERQTAEELVVNPQIYAKKTSVTAGGSVSLADVPLLENIEPSTTDYVLGADSEINQKTLAHDKKDKSRKSKKGGKTKEDLVVNSKVFALKACETSPDAINLADVPLLEKAVNERNKDRGQGFSGKADTKQESSQATYTKDAAWQSDVSVYRRRSGTYCVRRPAAGHEPFECCCAGQRHGYCEEKYTTKGTQIDDTQKNLSPRDKGRAPPTSNKGTYTLSSKSKVGSSSDNTDLEMSYLSDLPMEKEKRNPLKSRALSPGEERSATYSSTFSGHSPPTDYSLSEGEMPAPTAKRRQSESDREKLYLNATQAHKLETPPSQQMEAALQAITDELQRCKNLLHRHRPEQVIRQSTVT